VFSVAANRNFVIRDAEVAVKSGKAEGKQLRKVRLVKKRERHLAARVGT